MRRLTLTDFRCFRFQRLEVGPEPVVLTGPNGAGKTTVLEALSFLAPGRGLKRARLDEVERRDDDRAAADVWAVAAELKTPTGVAEIGTGRDASGSGRDRRVVRINGQAARSQAALTEVLAVVWLTPEMDRLFLDASSARRRFLDRLVFGVDPTHAERVGGYERAMRERARLLRQNRADPAWLDALEDRMACHGVAIAAARRAVVGRLARFSGEDALPFPGAELCVDGLVESWLETDPALAVEDRLRTRLRASRQVDAETGTTRAGPHRTDLVVHHRRTGRPASTCSTGEQKSLLVAIVLAAARMLAEDRGLLPLILLDEVAAHLDAGHRSALFDLATATGAQAWYTGTERALFQGLRGRAQMLAVEGAAIAPHGGD